MTLSDSRGPCPLLKISLRKTYFIGRLYHVLMLKGETEKYDRRKIRRKSREEKILKIIHTGKTEITREQDPDSRNR